MYIVLVLLRVAVLSYRCCSYSRSLCVVRMRGVVIVLVRVRCHCSCSVLVFTVVVPVIVIILVSARCC